MKVTAWALFALAAVWIWNGAARMLVAITAGDRFALVASGTPEMYFVKGIAGVLLGVAAIALGRRLLRNPRPEPPTQ